MHKKYYIKIELNPN